MSIELASGNGQKAGKHTSMSLITPSRRPMRSSELAVHTFRRPRNKTAGNAVCPSFSQTCTSPFSMLNRAQVTQPWLAIKSASPPQNTSHRRSR